MKSIHRTLVAGAAGFVGVLALVNMAGAQEAPSTTEPPAVEAPATPEANDAPSDPGPRGRGDHDCPERDGGGGGGGGTGGTTTSPEGGADDTAV
ncbi:MAG TPA: hypothetical protein VI854_09475 [Acidimicrobiia bacterium]|nr:hypothetical protein [Acidimicrobiia bacterium]